MMREQTEHVYVHIDELSGMEIESLESAGTVHVYTFEGDPQTDRLYECVEELRGAFIWADGIVFPEFLDGEIESMSVETLNATVWVHAVNGELNPDHVEKVKAVTDDG
jgi:hypothetical protein